MSEEISSDAPKSSEDEKKGGQVSPPKSSKDEEDTDLQERAKAKAAESKNEDG